jgi:hypothetical protein
MLNGGMYHLSSKIRNSADEYSYVGSSGTSLMFHSTALNGQLVSFSIVNGTFDVIIPGNPEKTLKLARKVSPC